MFTGGTIWLLTHGGGPLWLIGIPPPLQPCSVPGRRGPAAKAVGLRQPALILTLSTLEVLIFGWLSLKGNPSHKMD